MSTILHTTVGGIASSLGGGNISSGALGTGFSDVLLSNVHDNSVKEWLIIIIGSMAGKDGAFTALNRTKYNDELHPNYASDRVKLVQTIEENGREETVEWYWRVARVLNPEALNCSLASFNAYSCMFAGYYAHAFPVQTDYISNLLFAMLWITGANFLGLVFGWLSIFLSGLGKRVSDVTETSKNY
ncbi:hypothetical protein SPFL3102_01518 [Sporomusaceae bacterium FL31]|nr:hypothetical protein SPFL3101_03151 [Sporomusaceae bacterium FL31]GCE33710.1 hypothetical protein SPFL3102_01518 [Sporomusaceae bacterium]